MEIIGFDVNDVARFKTNVRFPLSPGSGIPRVGVWIFPTISMQLVGS